MPKSFSDAVVETLIIVGWVLLLIFLTALICNAQNPPQPADPFEGESPHSIPHCDVPARAQRTGGAPCFCLKMVGEIQQKALEQCWKESKFGVPPEGLDLPATFYPKEVKECLKEKIPNHCDIIGGQRHVPYQDNICRTKCKPERCECPDHSCPTHKDYDYDNLEEPID